jgi:hypothetical protein
METMLEQAAYLIHPPTRKNLDEKEWEKKQRDWSREYLEFTDLGIKNSFPVTTPKKRSADSLRSTPKRQRLSSPSRETPASTENPASDHASIAPSRTEGSAKINSRSIAATSLKEDPLVLTRKQHKVDTLRDHLNSVSAGAFVDAMDAEIAKEEADAAKKRADASGKKMAEVLRQIEELEAEIPRLRAKLSGSSSRP